MTNSDKQAIDNYLYSSFTLGRKLSSLITSSENEYTFNDVCEKLKVDEETLYMMLSGLFDFSIIEIIRLELIFDVKFFTDFTTRIQDLIRLRKV